MLLDIRIADVLILASSITVGGSDFNRPGVPMEKDLRQSEIALPVDPQGAAGLVDLGQARHRLELIVRSGGQGLGKSQEGCDE